MVPRLVAETVDFEVLETIDPGVIVVAVAAARFACSEKLGRAAFAAALAVKTGWKIW